MKRFFVLVSAVILAGAITSCTDISGLENRMDSAESRIAALEKNLGTLNSDIVALKKIVEGGTVSSIVEKDGVYTITFSDGTVITLNQGSTGIANAPIMSIDEDGYWMVDYGNGPEYILVSGEKVKAVGDNGVTPQFGVDTSGYWTVSYDGGKTFSQVKDVNGNPVKAVADGSSTSDSWFRSVTVKGDTLEVVLNDGSTYALLIVKDFSCVIKGAEDVVAFTYGQTKTFTVEMTGVASVMVTAPQGWSAALESEVLSITAPEAETKALSADSKTDVCLLAISENGYSSLSKVKVSVSSSADPTPDPDPDPDPVTYPGLYGKYYNGEDVTIGSVTVNKTTYPTVNYISATSTDKTLKTGVNFVDADVVAELPTEEIELPFIVAGNTEGTRTALNAASQVKFISSATVESNVVEFQNVSLSTENIAEGYLLANTQDNTMERIGLNNCRVDIVGDKNLSYMLSARNLNCFIVKDCDIKANSTKAVYLMQIQANEFTMAELTITNNVFWSDDAVKAFSVFHNRKSAVTKVNITQNTFVNVYPQKSYAYCQLDNLISGSVSNNLFYFEDYTTNCEDTYTGIVKEETKANIDETLYATFLQNYAIYGSSIPTKRMKVGQNTNPGQIYNKAKADASEVFDFTDDSENFNIAKGIFKSKKTAFGAQR